MAVSVVGRVRELREIAALALLWMWLRLDWIGMGWIVLTAAATGEWNGLGWAGCSWVLEVDETAAAGVAAGWPSCSRAPEEAGCGWRLDFLGFEGSTMPLKHRSPANDPYF